MHREKLFKTPLPAEHIAILQDKVSLYTKLPQALRQKLHGHINLFLDDMKFTGCAGFEVTDEVRIVITGNACLLLLRGHRRRFTGFSTIYIYPETYTVDDIHHDGAIAVQSTSKRAGESWMQGPIVLSWTDTIAGSINAEDGYNVVIHEFAHKLDEQSGHMNGLPLLQNRSQYINWNRVLSKEYDALYERAERSRNKVLNKYGTTSPAEFFAVASESFFEKPAQMKKRLPSLYNQLKIFYRIDPASWR